jgi:hypothetical protein
LHHLVRWRALVDPQALHRTAEGSGMTKKNHRAALKSRDGQRFRIRARIERFGQKSALSRASSQDIAAARCR